MYIHTKAFWLSSKITTKKNKKIFDRIDHFFRVVMLGEMLQYEESVRMSSKSWIFLYEFLKVQFFKNLIESHRIKR